jgi:hypothetical protein
MAIRPTDLQLSVVSQLQTPPIAQRGEEGPRAAQVAAQATFAAQAEQRNERVAETSDLQGNRIEVGERERDDQGQSQGRRRRRPGMPFEEPAAEAATDPGEPPHLIDFTA